MFSAKEAHKLAKVNRELLNQAAVIYDEVAICKHIKRKIKKGEYTLKYAYNIMACQTEEARDMLKKKFEENGYNISECFLGYDYHGVAVRGFYIDWSEDKDG